MYTSLFLLSLAWLVDVFLLVLVIWVNHFSAENLLHPSDYNLWSPTVFNSNHQGQQYGYLNSAHLLTDLHNLLTAYHKLLFFLIFPNSCSSCSLYFKHLSCSTIFQMHLTEMSVSFSCSLGFSHIHTHFPHLIKANFSSEKELF